MRTPIVHEGVKYLEYEIRQIVEVAKTIEALGVSMTWENIGDPIEMGEKVAPWIADTVSGLVLDSRSWAYCPTRGVQATREFLAGEVNKRGGVRITPNDILFVNGIADAVDKVYDMIRRDVRVIMPSPSYPTHTSNEAKRSEYAKLLFHLDPRRGWQPDIDDLRMKVKYNPQVAGIALVNPDNPTGIVYEEKMLREIVAIARAFGLFVICDEIYAHICFNGRPAFHLSEYLGDVPGLALRGISKEYPWPGARCGWFEILNADKDADFAVYTKGLLAAKMMEVCATTLPQMSIPRIFGDPRYPAHLKRRAEMFAKRAEEAYSIFSPLSGTIVNRVQGAFYFTVVFEDGVLNEHQHLAIENPKVASLIEAIVKGVSNDKRLVYYLMGAAGICVTPLSGFHCSLPGFRITLLQTDDAKRRETFQRIAGAIKAYLGSA
ncbi:MAG: pyridoxal phosphate-dependent aminotransferase [Planctomycetota bacterium]